MFSTDLVLFTRIRRRAKSRKTSSLLSVRRCPQTIHLKSEPDLRRTSVNFDSLRVFLASPIRSITSQCYQESLPPPFESFILTTRNNNRVSRVPRNFPTIIIWILGGAATRTSGKYIIKTKRFNIRIYYTSFKGSPSAHTENK